MVKDGFKFALPPLVLGLLALVPGWNWVAGILFLLGAFVLYFFRDPQRTIPSDPGMIVSPADGHVMEVLDEPLEGQPGQRISIFLSVFDVHVNRAPVEGEIRRIEYRPGRFYAAMRARASAENEQNMVRISSPQGDVVFKQIAGWIARRILCWKAVGDPVARGERVGMIRFGSRVDVWVPPDVDILVRRGQKVAGGSSILAKWKAT
jgi:phosphatidylserine decarboxylase